MAISIESLREGQRYFLNDRNLIIKELIDFDGRLQVLYEYQSEDKYTRLDQCPAIEFCDKALRNYRNDPEYAEIYPYVFVANLDDPETVVALLNKPVKGHKEVKALKYFVKELIDAGYRPAYFQRVKGLYLKESFLPMEKITETGMNFAIYLAKLNGWDGKVESLPDFYIPS